MCRTPKHLPQNNQPQLRPAGNALALPAGAFDTDCPVVTYD